MTFTQLSLFYFNTYILSDFILYDTIILKYNINIKSTIKLPVQTNLVYLLNFMCIRIV